MKYMNFNSSCSYAGIANCLEAENIDLQDFEIALKADIPYMFFFDSDEAAYLAGPQLQSKKWFDYCLNDLGFELIEEEVRMDEVPSFLIDVSKKNMRCMLGLNGLNIEGRKHACVFLSYDDGKFLFLNNKHKDSGEDEIINLNNTELLHALDDKNARIAYLKPYMGKSKLEERLADMAKSLETIEQYRYFINSYASKSIPVETLRNDMDRLFRSILLSVPSMMEIIGESELLIKLKSLLAQFMQAVRQDGEVKLFNYISEDALNEALTMYKEIIKLRKES